MESASRPLIPRDGKPLPVLLMMVMWSLGIIGWSAPQEEEERIHWPFIGSSKWRRRFAFILSMCFMLCCVIVSFAGSVEYLVCYFGKSEHLLRFLSVVLCYWPIVMAVPTFCLVAFVRNNFIRLEDTVSNITWSNVFRESEFIKHVCYLRGSTMKPLPEVEVFLFFDGLALSISCFVVVLYADMYKSCESLPSYVWMVAEVIALLYVATFSYYLYLQRIILEEQGKQTLSCVKSNEGNLETCIPSVKKFYCNYMQLRRLLLPWLYVVIFSSAFGLAVFLTWAYKYNSSQTSPETIHPPTYYIGEFCSYSCDDKIWTKESIFTVYSIILFGKLFMPPVLAFFVVKGLDIKHVWDRLYENLRLMFSTKDLEFWKCLMKYVDKLHPNVTFSAFAGFVIPVLGLASGLLGAHKLLV